MKLSKKQAKKVDEARDTYIEIIESVLTELGYKKLDQVEDIMEIGEDMALNAEIGSYAGLDDEDGQ